MKISGYKKGYVKKFRRTIKKINELNKSKISFIIQELIISDDKSNFKVNFFIDKKGNFTHSFCLKKIHQFPINFGIASTAVSVFDKNLIEIGKNLFRHIGYTGIGSAEFKYDNIDKKFKLIEINSRYWQQNALADFCGINFPLIDYLHATGQKFFMDDSYTINKKYLNLGLSIKSFKMYEKK